MLRTNLILSLVGFAFLLGGCDKGASGDGASSGAIAVFRVPESTVLVKVGDRAVTAGDFRRRLAYESGIFKFTMENAKQKPKDPENRVAKFEAQRLPRILPQLVHCALLDAYLEGSCGGRDVAVSEAECEKAVSRLMPKNLRKEGMDGLAKALGVEVDYLKDQILVPAREDKARLVFDPASAEVSEKEIDEGLARMDAYTARAVASNQVIWVTASNVLAQVRGGADFAKLGETVGEGGAEASEWAFFNREDLTDAALRDWAFSTKVGSVGGPFELDDGLSIVKVLSRKDGTDVASLASAQTAEVTLARIHFPMVEEHPEPRTREHCRQALLNWKARKAKDGLFEKLFKETKIEYPNGDKLEFGR